MRQFTERAARFAPYSFRINWLLAAALLVACAAALPLLAEPGLLNTRGGGDSPFLLQRLHQLETAVRDGHFPVRWMPDANYGYGYPFYNFYAPLSIYITMLFRLAGFSYVRAIHLSQLAAFLAAAWGVFKLGRRWWRSDWAGFVTAAAYTLAPFHMVNVYVRGDSLAEFWAMALYPWVILAAEGVIGNRYAVVGNRYAVVGNRNGKNGEQYVVPRRWRVAGLALAYAALILSHNISALIFSPFLLLYFAIRGPWSVTRSPKPEARGPEPEARGPRPVARNRITDYGLRITDYRLPIAALLLAFALAAWFFVPALAEQSLAQLGPVTEGYFHFSNHFRGWDLVQGRLFFDYNPDGGQAFRMGLVQAATAVAGLLVLFWYWRRDRRSRPATLFVTLTLAVATLMITPLSRLLWEYLPLLPFTQFPWRFLSVQAFGGALAAGGLALLPRRAWVAGGTTILLLVSALGALETDHLILSDRDVTAERLAQYEWFTGNIGTTVSAEYLPPAVQPRPVTSPWLELGARDRLQVMRGEITAAEIVERGAARQRWQIETTAAGSVIFPTLDWPGWTAVVNGEAEVIETAPGTGLIMLTLPPGTHEVTLRLERTPVRLAAELLSLAALCLTLWLLRPAQWKRPQRATLGALALAGMALALLSVTVRLWPRLGRLDTDLTWDFAQMGYLHHDVDGVSFAGGPRLTQYTYAQDVAVRGNTIQITLDTPDAQGEEATLALTTPAVHRFAGAPVVTQVSQPLSARTTFSLTIPANAPAGLVVPRLQVADSPPLMPSGRTRGDLFLRPLRIAADGGFIAGDTKELDLRLLEDKLIDNSAEQRLLLKMGWYTAQPLPQNLNVSLRLLDGAGQMVAQFDTQPGYGFRPSSSWPRDRWVNDWLALPLPADLPATAELMVQLYKIGGEVVLHRHLGTLAQGKVLPRTPVFSLPDELVAETAVYRNAATNLVGWRGYTLSQSSSQAVVTLYWEALSPLPTDYTRFLHLLNETGSLVRQSDAMPQANSYPTSQWAPGEIVADRVVLDLNDLPAGPYRLHFGFYENLGDQWPRLTAVGADGSPVPDDAVALPELIKIEP